MKLTNITLPESQFSKLAEAKLANRSFFLRSTLVAFESSEQCNLQFISNLPDLGKCSTWRGDHEVKTTVSMKFETRELKQHKKIATQVAGKSLSLLVSAALFWQSGGKVAA